MPPPPPPSIPPPPPALIADVAALDLGNDRSALFAEINQGENITKSKLFNDCKQIVYILIFRFEKGN